MIQNNAGNVSSVTIIPNPFVSVLDNTYATNGYTSVAPGARGLTNFAAPGTPFVYGISTPALLDGVLNTYRVVSMGIRISTQLPQSVCTGRVIIAPLMATAEMPSYNALTNTNLAASLVYNRAFGTAGSSLCSAALLELPGAQACSMADLYRGDIEIPLMLNAPAFYTFKNTGNYTASGVYTFGDNPMFNAGAVIQTGDADTISSVGANSFVIYFEGASGVLSGTLPLMAVELIYHLEGTPILTVPASAGVGAGAVAPVPSQGMEIGRFVLGAVESAIASRAGQSVCRFIKNEFQTAMYGMASRGALAGRLAIMP